ncbi:cation-transporting P-type ATPase [bacterium]|nr:cation-transporting P-type ATPase [bacterium]
MANDSLITKCASQSPQWCLEQLNSTLEIGLTQEAADERLNIHGFNALMQRDNRRWTRTLIRQFQDLLIFILSVAAVLSFLIGDITDSLAIGVIIFINGVLGFLQEWKAEKALDALKQMVTRHCQVRRAGEVVNIETRQLVPGDIVLLEAGDSVPADLRILEATNLRADQSLVTGEVDSVAKAPDPNTKDTPLAELSSCVWMGSVITNGHGIGLVVHTGMKTHFGQIATLTSSLEEEKTPLQLSLARLAQKLAALAFIVAFTIALTGWLTGKPLLQMIMAAIAISVAVVPEGLPAVVTITLALGLTAMVKKKAIVRKLQAAETLGATSVICTDKTGTITRNEMTATHILLGIGQEYRITGRGYAPHGDICKQSGESISSIEHEHLTRLLYTAMRCNRATIRRNEQGLWEALGEPTEAALFVAGLKADISLREDISHLSEFSFSSERKRMTVLEHGSSGTHAFVKGAPEVILRRCTQILQKGHQRTLTWKDKAHIVEQYTNLASQGLRLLALAEREVSSDIPLDEKNIENELCFLGIIGMQDPPRNEVPAAIKKAQRAGIQIILITGDAAETAKAISKQVGLDITAILDGGALDRLSDDELRNHLHGTPLFARTTPEHKLRLVTLLQHAGHVVAMTGDGVNDAPALKRADVGVAMGRRGTDVARGASDIILTDDNFSSIIGAIEEGRRQYDNIQKFVLYLLSSNVGEILAIFINIIIGGPLILLPVQILWMNLITDGMTAVALGLEPAEKGIMEEPPRKQEMPILGRDSLNTLLFLGGYIGIATLFIFYLYQRFFPDADPILANTAAFTGMVLLEKANVFNFRSSRSSLFSIPLGSNKWLLWAWIGSLSLQGFAVYTPLLQEMLHTTSLRLFDWLFLISTMIPVLIIGELLKRLER